jgi:hypothetical protein
MNGFKGPPAVVRLHAVRDCGVRGTLACSLAPIFS